MNRLDLRMKRSLIIYKVLIFLKRLMKKRIKWD